MNWSMSVNLLINCQISDTDTNFLAARITLSNIGQITPTFCLQSYLSAKSDMELQTAKMTVTLLSAYQLVLPSK